MLVSSGKSGGCMKIMKKVVWHMKCLTWRWMSGFPQVCCGISGRCGTASVHPVLLLCHVSTFSAWQARWGVKAHHIFLACHVAIPLPPPLPLPQWRDLVTEGVSANLSFLKDVWLWYCVPLVQMLMRECVHSTSWCSISVQKTTTQASQVNLRHKFTV